MESSSDETQSEADFWACNIDRRGRGVRLFLAFIFLCLSAWLWWGKGEAFWSIGLLTIGLLALYEGLRGWCVLRAFGMSTPV